MNEKKEFLNEENYQKNNKKLSKIILTIFIIGLSLGICLIVIGIVKGSNNNYKYSEDNKTKIQEQLVKEKTKLEEKKQELEALKVSSLEAEKEKLLKSKTELETKIKPVQDEIKSLERTEFRGFDDAYYERKDKIEELKKSIEKDEKSISIIDNALDESFDHCAIGSVKNNSYTASYCQIKNNQTKELKSIGVIDKALDETFDYCNFDETKNNSITAKYCSLKLELEDINRGFGKKSASYDSIPFFIIGGFIIFTSCMICGSLYLSLVKKREIMAYGMQQMMPIAQEGIEKMAPTVGKAGASIAEEMGPTIGKVGATIAKEMAPVYGSIAKEISKGIKEGMKDETPKPKEKKNK